jgi:Na+-translocating ferredoxin:NAD+ oxidoreductase RnfG subunit
MNNSGLSWRGIVSLTLIAGICGSVLVATNQFTAPKIDAQRTAQARALMLSLLSPQQQQELDWTQIENHNVITACTDWWLIHISENGYAGPIDLLAYWQTFDNGDPSLLKLRVLAHLETPGIGDFIDHQRDNYLPNQDDSTAAQWQSTDTVTGATITHNALRQAALTVAQRLNTQARAHYCNAAQSATQRTALTAAHSATQRAALTTTHSATKEAEQ